MPKNVFLRAITHLIPPHTFPGRSVRIALALVAVGVACSAPESLQAIQSALSSNDVFGFETTSGWSTTTQGVTITLSSNHSQGSSSLSIRPSSSGYVSLVSAPLSTLAAVSTTIAWDVYLPSQQPNPNWYGDAQMFVNCPSRGIYNSYLADVQLTGKPLGVWNTIAFPLSNALVSSLLNAGYSDLTMTVVVNLPIPPSANAYFVDNLRFLPVAANACGGKPNGTLCTDNNNCTQTDACQSGACVGANPVVCSAQDQCHVSGTCAPTTGLCSTPPKANGTSCNDGNACTQSDTCISGVCTGANPVGCTASDQCHQPGVCAPATGLCSNPQKPDGSSCNDGNLCTQVDLCQSGTCIGTAAVVCSAADQCHDPGQCLPSTGVCSNPAKGVPGPTEGLVVPPNGGALHCAIIQGSSLSLGQTAASLSGSAQIAIRSDGTLTLDMLDAHSGTLCQGSQCSTADLELDSGSPAMGSLSLAQGTFQMGVPAVIRFADRSAATTKIVLAVSGAVQHRIVTMCGGSTLPASAPMFPGAGANVFLSCQEQEDLQVIQATFQIDASGSISYMSSSVALVAAPIVHPLGSGYVMRTIDAHGNIIERIPFVDPRAVMDGSPLSTATFTLAIPFDNGITAVALDAAGGQLVQVDLTQTIAAFCQGAPSNPGCLASNQPQSAQGTTFSALSSQVIGGTVARAQSGTVDVAVDPNQSGFFPNDLKPAVAMTSDGAVIVAWSRTTSTTSDLRVRTFDGSSSLPTSSDSGLVSSGYSGAQEVRVAGSTTGMFVASWREISLSDLTQRIMAKRISSTGNQMGGSISVASDSKSGSQSTGVGDFDVAMDGQGRFTLVWVEVDQTGITTLKAARFNSDGTPDGAAWTLSGPTGAIVNPQHLHPRIAAATSGDFTVGVNIHDTEGAPTQNNIRVMNFNANKTKRGNDVVLNNVGTDFALAMPPDVDGFSLVRSTGGHILATRYDSSGAFKESNLRIDAKERGDRMSPALAILPGGKTMAAWRDEAISGTQDQVGVVAELYDADFVPNDIDFDTGRSRGSIPPAGEQGFNPAPVVAAGSGRFVVAWEGIGGIRFQLFGSDQYACPSDVACTNIVPLAISGTDADSYDIVFSMDTAGLFSAADFARHVVNRMVNGPFAIPIVEQKRRVYNVYYRGGGTGSSSFADQNAIASAQNQGSQSGGSAIYDHSSLSSFQHETGHGFFGLSDEYDCGNGTYYFEATLNHPNLFASPDHCQAMSVSPSACRPLSGCSASVSWTEADRSCVMGGPGTVDTINGPFYGLDCQAHIADFMTRIPCRGMTAVCNL